ncbi:MAG TPA: MATE family efflux transporter, partial [Megasphaera sp.]|nr:MATE family efflux transporter [Megasphaera sp.]
MLHGPLWNKLIIFALPLALTGVLQQLFNAADVAVLGQFVGTHAMAAVGNNTPVISLFVTLFLGLSLGANVVIARYLGARCPEQAGEAVHTTFMLALLVGILLMILGEATAGIILSHLGVPDVVMPAAELYLRIYMLGLPFISFYNFQSAIFRSRGDTRTPLVALAVASGLNIVLNLLFTGLFSGGV